MLKITKQENNSNWLLCDYDFRSLQMVLGFADAGLNDDGIGEQAYQMYLDTVMTERGNGVELSDIDMSKAQIGDNDAHSHTAFAVFIESVNREVIEIEDENGKKIIFDPEQKIVVGRKNLIGKVEEIVITGAEFQPEDEFVKYSD